MFAQLIFVFSAVFTSYPENFVATDPAQLTDFSNRDSTLYTAIEKGFYQGPYGKLYIRTQSFCGMGNTSGYQYYQEVPDLDVQTYQVLCSEFRYARDKDNVYILDSTEGGKSIKICQQADAHTFQCMNNGWGMDKRYVFFNGLLLVGMNPQTIQIVDADASGQFSMIKDEDQLFWGHREIQGVDVASFTCERTDTSITYQDKNWIYELDYFQYRNEENRKKK